MTLLKDTPCYEDAFYNLCLHYLNSSHPVEVFLSRHFGKHFQFTTDSLQERSIVLCYGKICSWEIIIAKSVKKLHVFSWYCEQNTTVECAHVLWNIVVIFKALSGHRKVKICFLRPQLGCLKSGCSILMAAFSRTFVQNQAKARIPKDLGSDCSFVWA